MGHCLHACNFYKKWTEDIWLNRYIFTNLEIITLQDKLIRHLQGKALIKRGRVQYIPLCKESRSYILLSSLAYIVLIFSQFLRWLGSSTCNVLIVNVGNCETCCDFYRRRLYGCTVCLSIHALFWSTILCMNEAIVSLNEWFCIYMYMHVNLLFLLQVHIKRKNKIAHYTV